MLKRFFPVLLAAVMLLGGCSLSEEKPESDKLQVVTTIFPAYDFARQVFGDTADVTLLLKPGMESHSYDPSARDIVKIDSCDLFIYNGGESDAWVENVLKSADEVNALRMMDAVEALEEDSEGIAEAEEHDRDEDTEYDEHIWTSPKNAALIVESIKQAAVAIAPQNKALYESVAGEYAAEIDALDEKFTELLADEERIFVFGDRFPLLYFFRGYGLNYLAAFPGCGSETEPSAQTIAALAERLSGSGTVPAVFCIELSGRKLAETLANENAFPVAEFHTCHNITADDFAAGESYVSLMERNFQMLENILTNGG
ncbi:MAG: metal ABC transporter substrate-binding protein [Lachnospiraceae bacterium]|nr:metal ABC transporter substrate-binding protein [Ruminococcus sp.]MCM1274044.1 metal ABC transporter substrate-binding protein [Lachnospiraceae bacterium]